jgi:hypothetical protein
MTQNPSFTLNFYARLSPSYIGHLASLIGVDEDVGNLTVVARVGRRVVAQALDSLPNRRLLFARCSAILQQTLDFAAVTRLRHAGPFQIGHYATLVMAAPAGHKPISAEGNITFETTQKHTLIRTYTR